MFVGCCLTSWFSKKQTALAISTTEAEYYLKYLLYDRVMYPLVPQHERKTRKDYGTKRGCHSTSASSSSAFDHPSSSHYVDDDNDEDDEGTSRASTPSKCSPYPPFE
ncbi:hypothetical protein Tco_0968459 [Tanacetum coccineum]